MERSVKKTKTQPPAVAAKFAAAGARPEVTKPKRPAGTTFTASTKAANSEQQRARFREEDLPGLDRQSGKRQAIAEAGE